MSVLCSKRAKEDPWLVKLLASKAAQSRRLRAGQQSLPRRRPGMARIGWAVMMRQADYRRRPQDQPRPDRPELGAVLAAVKTASRAPSAVAFGQS